MRCQGSRTRASASPSVCSARSARRRRNELQRQQISTEELRNSPDLQPGLSFGRFDTRAAADAALARLQQQGIKPTRVVTIHIPIVVTLLRVERADGALAARLTQLNL